MQQYLKQQQTVRYTKQRLELPAHPHWRKNVSRLNKS